MKAWLAVLALVVAFQGQTGSPPPAPARSAVVVRLETALGRIDIEVDPRAPVTAANFLRYVEGGYYDGGRFHRTVRSDNQPNNRVKIDVVQAGPNPDAERPELAPI